MKEDMQRVGVTKEHHKQKVWTSDGWGSWKDHTDLILNKKCLKLSGYSRLKSVGSEYSHTRQTHFFETLAKFNTSRCLLT